MRCLVLLLVGVVCLVGTARADIKSFVPDEVADSIRSGETAAILEFATTVKQEDPDLARALRAAAFCLRKDRTEFDRRIKLVSGETRLFLAELCGKAPPRHSHCAQVVRDGLADYFSSNASANYIDWARLCEGRRIDLSEEPGGWEAIGIAACRIRDSENASNGYAKLDGDRKYINILAACKRTMTRIQFREDGDLSRLLGDGPLFYRANDGSIQPWRRR